MENRGSGILLDEIQGPHGKKKPAGKDGTLDHKMRLYPLLFHAVFDRRCLSGQKQKSVEKRNGKTVAHRLNRKKSRQCAGDE